MTAGGTPGLMQVRASTGEPGEALRFPAHPMPAASPVACPAGRTAGAAPTESAGVSLARAVPEAAPNQRILRMGGDALGIGPALCEAAEAAFATPRARHGARGAATGLRLPQP